MSENGNLALWRSVEQTDPRHTKPVDLGRKYTSIDTYYQVRRATEMFGPVGIGWGWRILETRTENGLIMVLVEMWYVLDGKRSEPIPTWTSSPLLVKTKGGEKADDDAGKKAVTDAITKLLSYLGFSADVFMGRFDDDKYVARLRAERAAAERAAAEAPAKAPAKKIALTPEQEAAVRARLERPSVLPRPLDADGDADHRTWAAMVARFADLATHEDQLDAFEQENRTPLDTLAEAKPRLRAALAQHFAERRVQLAGRAAA